MSTQQTTNMANGKVIPSKTSQLSTQTQPPASSIKPPASSSIHSWIHPATMIAPFTNFLGSGNGFKLDTQNPIVNIFNREISHLNHLAGRDATLIIDVTEEEKALVVVAHIGAPKESKCFPIVVCRCVRYNNMSSSHTHSQLYFPPLSSSSSSSQTSLSSMTQIISSSRRIAMVNMINLIALLLVMSHGQERRLAQFTWVLTLILLP